MTQLIRRSKTFREEMLDHDILLSYIDTMMLETSDAYWMNAAQIIEIQLGEKLQYLHRDLENYPVLFRSLGPAGPGGHVQLPGRAVRLHRGDGCHAHHPG
ncbi:MAG: hypothetical protein PW845_08170 [Pseudomonas sp.]|nr:hypothetical protein [Pseudomonas sp.]